MAPAGQATARFSRRPATNARAAGRCTPCRSGPAMLALARSKARWSTLLLAGYWALGLVTFTPRAPRSGPSRSTTFIKPPLRPQPPGRSRLPIFNVGERAEGYTSFAWMLLAAAAHALPWSPEATIKLGSLLAAIVAIGLAGALAAATVRGHGALASWRAASFTVAVLLVYPGTAVHAVAGLETSLYAAACVALWLLSLRVVRGAPRSATAFALASLALGLVRPTGTSSHAPRRRWCCSNRRLPLEGRCYGGSRRSTSCPAPPARVAMALLRSTLRCPSRQSRARGALRRAERGARLRDRSALSRVPRGAPRGGGRVDPSARGGGAGRRVRRAVRVLPRAGAPDGLRPSLPPPHRLRRRGALGRGRLRARRAARCTLHRAAMVAPGALRCARARRAVGGGAGVVPGAPLDQRGRQILLRRRIEGRPPDLGPPAGRARGRRDLTPRGAARRRRGPVRVAMVDHRYVRPERAHIARAAGAIRGTCSIDAPIC